MRTFRVNLCASSLLTIHYNRQNNSRARDHISPCRAAVCRFSFRDDAMHNLLFHWPTPERIRSFTSTRFISEYGQPERPFCIRFDRITVGTRQTKGTVKVSMTTLTGGGGAPVFVSLAGCCAGGTSGDTEPPWETRCLSGPRPKRFRSTCCSPFVPLSVCLRGECHPC